MPDTLLVVDANSLVHRAYHALPPLTTSEGLPVNAVFGFAQTLLKLLQDHAPRYAVAAFDPPGETFRHQRFAAYKAQRPETPPDLVQQYGLVREVVDVCGLPSVVTPGYEADDVIAALAVRAAAQGLQVLVVSLDRDVLQLIGEHVRVLSPGRGEQDAILFDAAEVERRYGYRPEQVPDAKGLIGDPSDNLPGVPGIGKKTAAELLAAYGSLEAIIEHTAEVKSKRAREALEQYAAVARECKQLATLDREAPVAVRLEELRWPGVDQERCTALLRQLEFTSLLSRVPRSTQAAWDATYHLARGAEALEPLRAHRAGPLAAATDAAAGLLALAVQPGEAVAVAFSLLEAEDEAAEADLFGASEQAPDAQVAAAVRATMEELLSTPELRMHAPGSKEVLRVLEALRLPVPRIASDPEVAAYLLEPHKRDHSPETVSRERVGLIPPAEPPGEAGVGPEAFAVCLRADLTLRLAEPLAAQLAQEGLTHLMTEVEMPLVAILHRMETAGIAVDRGKLAALGQTMGGRLAELREQIHASAGAPFNIDSPKQLAAVLFGELKLPAGRRTKTGASTSAEVLEKLRGRHPIIEQLLEYRTFTKLKSTYVDALARLAEEHDGRVHTSFEQTVTATGRLSSRDPNLQNIPIRSDWGGEIRSCFVAGDDGWRLLSADYSQIELRILAHFSEDESLCSAFRAGEDIHTRTAAQMFEVPLEAVTPDMRRRAKTVNFAVIYGMGAASLAEEIGVTRAEAEAFIESYFAKLPGVRRYSAATLEGARCNGYVTTLMGRKRALPELHSPEGQTRSYAERAAVNAPIQGTAADIIKVAMVRLPRELERQGTAARLLLQVHDELLLEVPADAVAAVGRLVKEVMEGACELAVPLVVEAAAGHNWRDLEPLPGKRREP